MDNRRKPIGRWLCGVALSALIAHGVVAQPPVPSGGSTAPAVCNRRGRLHRLFHHTTHTLEDTLIGHPDNFIEPPLGYYVNQQFAVQVSRADPHRFTVYGTDFLPGTDRFSPIGASRFNLMFARLPDWSGPILVEWTPDQPDLAQAHRQAVLDTLTRAGSPVLAQRVLIGPSPYPGARGVEATNQYMNSVFRNQAASHAFPLSPIESSSMGVR